MIEIFIDIDGNCLAYDADIAFPERFHKQLPPIKFAAVNAGYTILLDKLNPFIVDIRN